MPQVGPGNEFNPYATERAKGGRKLISSSPATLNNCDTTCGLEWTTAFYTKTGSEIKQHI
jgi:hypothetical protein